MPHRIGRVRRSLEQPALYIEGRGGVRTRARRALRVQLHLRPRGTALNADIQLFTVDARALRQRDERIMRRGQPRPGVLMQIECVMRLPEPALPGGAHRHFGGCERVRMDAREGKVDEYPTHLAGSNELA